MPEGFKDDGAEPPSKWHVFVTGHSLGGALATLLALELSSSQLAKNSTTSALKNKDQLIANNMYLSQLLYPAARGSLGLLCCHATITVYWWLIAGDLPKFIGGSLVQSEARRTSCFGFSKLFNHCRPKLSGSYIVCLWFSLDHCILSSYRHIRGLRLPDLEEVYSLTFRFTTSRSSYHLPTIERSALVSTGKRQGSHNDDRNSRGVTISNCGSRGQGSRNNGRMGHGMHNRKDKGCNFCGWPNHTRDKC
ncbi:unnamed protein product [Thlaspi arvense]|uniref:Fungal lipase-type domain-containing protein n=1 Tax=Thlaspi arvense TaxID=13288 RepID=A0AAU9RWR2_THLAR|nr:unnamed protein product [Thlaspi arvense]